MSSECFSLFLNFNRVQTVLVKAIQLIYQLSKHLNVGIVARQDTINKPVFDKSSKVQNSTSFILWIFNKITKSCMILGKLVFQILKSYNRKQDISADYVEMKSVLCSDRN